MSRHVQVVRVCLLLYAGFAIPIDVVRRVVPQLIQNGKVTRASLNVQVIA